MYHICSICNFPEQHGQYFFLEVSCCYCHNMGCEGNKQQTWQPYGHKAWSVQRWFKPLHASYTRIGCISFDPFMTHWGQGVWTIIPPESNMLLQWAVKVQWHQKQPWYVKYRVPGWYICVSYDCSCHMEARDALYGYISESHGLECHLRAPCYCHRLWRSNNSKNGHPMGDLAENILLLDDTLLCEIASDVLWTWNGRMGGISFAPFIASLMGIHHNLSWQYHAADMGCRVTPTSKLATI